MTRLISTVQLRALLADALERGDASLADECSTALHQRGTQERVTVALQRCTLAYYELQAAERKPRQYSLELQARCSGCAAVAANRSECVTLRDMLGGLKLRWSPPPGWSWQVSRTGIGLVCPDCRGRLRERYPSEDGPEPARGGEL